MDPKNFAPNSPGSLQFNAEGYWTYHPYALPPLFRWTDRLVKALSSADRAVSALNFRASTASDWFFRLTAKLEAVSSCQITGYEIRLAEYLWSDGAHSHIPHLLPEPQRAVKRLAEAVMLYCGFDPPDLLSIAAAHENLWPGVLDQRWPPGQFRDGQTWIGTNDEGPEAAEFVPPPRDSMFQSLDGLNNFIQYNESIPELIRLAMIHYQLSVIHPFYDANGRTNRLLIPWLMCSWGLLPGPCLALSKYFSAHQETYNNCLAAVCQENAWEDWIVFFLDGLSEEASAALDLLERIENFRELLAERLKGERTAERLIQIVDLAVPKGFLTVNEVNGIFPRGNFKSAARYVDKLVELGMLKEITGQVRHRVFQLIGILEVFSAQE